MAKYNFDTVLDRKGTNAMKVDALKTNFGDGNLIPLWVADMDFNSTDEIREALDKIVKHGVFGYPTTPESYFQSILDWLSNYHDWNVKREWINYVPGIVKGISFILDCFIKDTDKVIIQPPVYPPFRNVPNMHKIKIVENPLLVLDGKFEMDLDNLAEIINPSCRALILCNPHNPGGRIWTKDELIKIADLCYENGVLVISDEIHGDLALNGNKHIPFATVSEKAAQNSITLMAPSKTFNIAGIVSSFFVIPNDLLRTRFNEYLEVRELSSPHMFVCPATEAAYRFGGEWLKEVKTYIEENINYVSNFIKTNIPQIKVMKPDASFLLWLDCTGFNLTQEELVSFFIKEAKLALNDGISFGKQGEGFMRMNIGTSRKNLEKAMLNLKSAVERKHL